MNTILEKQINFDLLGEVFAEKVEPPKTKKAESQKELGFANTIV